MVHKRLIALCSRMRSDFQIAATVCNRLRLNPPEFPKNAETPFRECGAVL